MGIDATTLCSFGGRVWLENWGRAQLLLDPRTRLFAVPLLRRAAPVSITVTLNNTLLAQPASRCQRFSRLAKYVGVHTVTRRTYYSVTLITVNFFYFFFSWIKHFITTLIPSCYWVNPMKAVFVVLVFWGNLHPGLCWTFIINVQRRNQMVK